MSRLNQITWYRLYIFVLLRLLPMMTSNTICLSTLSDLSQVLSTDIARSLIFYCCPCPNNPNLLDFMNLSMASLSISSLLFNIWHPSPTRTGSKILLSNIIKLITLFLWVLFQISLNALHFSCKSMSLYRKWLSAWLISYTT